MIKIHLIKIHLIKIKFRLLGTPIIFVSIVSLFSNSVLDFTSFEVKSRRQEKEVAVSRNGRRQIFFFCKSCLNRSNGIDFRYTPTLWFSFESGS